jgi:uncharacterized membrane protein YcaP (DUF421 family)
MELHRIALRALFAYVVLLALVRASGKRTVAQGTPFAFVLALVIGDMVDDLLWAEVGAATFTAAVGTLALTHTVVAWGAARYPWADRLVTGVPTPVLSDGESERDGLRAERMNEKGLAAELRHEGIDRDGWSRVKSAHVESSGAVSVLKAWADRPLPRKEAGAIRRRP